MTAGLRVLLVEDHADTLHLLARLLQMEGHEVRAAATVAEALHLASADGGCDVLVSDIGLPDGTGLDVMRHVRERYGLKGIAISGFGMDEDVARSLGAGFAEHLVKPVDLDHLEAAIGRVVGERTSAV